MKLQAAGSSNLCNHKEKLLLFDWKLSPRHGAESKGMGRQTKLNTILNFFMCTVVNLMLAVSCARTWMQSPVILHKTQMLHDMLQKLSSAPAWYWKGPNPHADYCFAQCVQLCMHPPSPLCGSASVTGEATTFPFIFIIILITGAYPKFQMWFPSSAVSIKRSWELSLLLQMLAVRVMSLAPTLLSVALKVYAMVRLGGNSLKTLSVYRISWRNEASQQLFATQA